MFYRTLPPTGSRDPGTSQPVQTPRADADHWILELAAAKPATDE
jgi:hypothetical protein